MTGAPTQAPQWTGRLCITKKDRRTGVRYPKTYHEVLPIPGPGREASWPRMESGRPRIQSEADGRPKHRLTAKSNLSNLKSQARINGDT